MLGFIGPRREAEDIRDRVRGFLKEKLALDLSEEKTLITHATDDKAHFLGHELSKARPCDYVSGPFKEAPERGHPLEDAPGGGREGPGDGLW